MTHGKKYRAASATVDKMRMYSFTDAVAWVKENGFASFDETVELSINLNIKKSQIVRDTFAFPHAFGAELKVLVFAEGDKAEEALQAGASYVGGQDLINQIKGGWLDFDVAVATPDMMQSVGKLGAILGRRGLMPNPKSHTVTNDVATAIKELKGGRVEFRSDKTGSISIAVGKRSMENNMLVENVRVACGEILRRKPAETKGHFFRTASLSATMSPSLRLNIAEIE